MRAHLYRAIQDAKGNLITAASVRLLDPDTGSPISDTLYADATSGTTLTNPFAISSTGYVDVYLDTARRVTIGVTVTGVPEFVFTGIDIDDAPDPVHFTASVVTALADPAAVAAIETVVAQYLADNSFYPSLVIGSGDPLPTTAPQGATLDILASSAVPSLAVTSILTEAIAGGTSVTTNASPPVLGAGTVVIAAVSTRTAGASSATPSPLPSSFAGMGLIWSPIDLPVDATINGADCIALYLGKGTGTAAKPVIRFTSAPTSVHLRIARIANAVGTVNQVNSVAAAANLATPTVSLPTAPGAASASLCWIVQNSATNPQTPGTGYTELASGVSSNAILTSAEYALPSRKSASWNTPVSPSGFQKLLAIVEVS